MYIRLKDDSIHEVMQKVIFGDHQEHVGYLVRKNTWPACLNVMKGHSDAQLIHQSPNFDADITDDLFNAHFWYYDNEIKDEYIYESNKDAKELLRRWRSAT